MVVESRVFFFLTENNDGRTRVDTALLESLVFGLHFLIGMLVFIKLNTDSIRLFQRIFEDGDALFLQFIDRPAAIYCDCLEALLIIRFGSFDVDIVFSIGYFVCVLGLYL